MVGDRTTITIDTLSGVKTLELTVRDGKMLSARVDMGAAILKPADIPVNMGGDTVIDAPLVVDEKVYHVTCVSMGNPHAVVFMHGIDNLDLSGIGPQFEHHPLFPRRTNTEFVEVVDRHHLKMRVWERGAGETLACGTGACASVVAAVLTGNTERKVRMKLLGGELDIEWDEATNHVFMTGGAVTVFTGEWLG